VQKARQWTVLTNPNQTVGHQIVGISSAAKIRASPLWLLLVPGLSKHHMKMNGAMPHDVAVLVDL
jgi:hypothetical protein